jgi:hypothetical protein
MTVEMVWTNPKQFLCLTDFASRRGKWTLLSISPAPEQLVAKDIGASVVESVDQQPQPY